MAFFVVTVARKPKMTAERLGNSTWTRTGTPLAKCECEWDAEADAASSGSLVLSTVLSRVVYLAPAPDCARHCTHRRRRRPPRPARKELATAKRGGGRSDRKPQQSDRNAKYSPIVAYM